MEEDRYKIAVRAATRFIAEQSSERDARYLFAYTITIENLGTVAAQLVSRHWIITDSENKVQEVRGVGVVGNQPLLQPGDRFEYTSGAQLTTPVGTMRGSYQMVAADGTAFDALIPQFTLAAPRTLH
jgi:ApaG protein